MQNCTCLILGCVMRPRTISVSWRCWKYYTTSTNKNHKSWGKWPSRYQTNPHSGHSWSVLGKKWSLKSEVQVIFIFLNDPSEMLWLIHVLKVALLFACRLLSCCCGLGWLLAMTNDVSDCCFCCLAGLLNIDVLRNASPTGLFNSSI